MDKIIPPGSTIGILGGGQLGKMSATAAHALGYKTIVWGQSEAEPALQACTNRIIAPFDDTQALSRFSNSADVVTTEWENIPVELLEKMAHNGMLVRPSSKVVAIAQSRRSEKKFARSIGAEPAPHLYIRDLGALKDTKDYADLFPGILKTDRLGYDGRGQVSVGDYTSLAREVERLAVPCILEKRVFIQYECSAVVARNSFGEIAISDVVMNTHIDGILAETSWGIGFPSNIQRRVGATLHAAAHALCLEGIMVIEFFVSGNQVYFNEMAPRPHNSFHGSIEAAYTSQFEQHVRAICGLPLGRIEFHSPFRMLNLLRSEGDEWESYLANPKARIHQYGKAVGPGKVRKMGHVTILR